MGKNKKVKDGDKPTLKRPAAAAKAKPKKGQGSTSKGGSCWAKALDKEEEQPEEEELDPEETNFAMDQGQEQGRQVQKVTCATPTSK